MDEINFDEIFARIDEISAIIGEVEHGISHMDRDLEIANTKIACLTESKEDILRLVGLVFGDCNSE